jgi:hypothetical protein
MLKHKILANYLLLKIDQNAAERYYNKLRKLIVKQNWFLAGLYS